MIKYIAWLLIGCSCFASIQIAQPGAGTAYHLKSATSFPYNNTYSVYIVLDGMDISKRDYLTSSGKSDTLSSKFLLLLNADGWVNTYAAGRIGAVMSGAGASQSYAYSDNNDNLSATGIHRLLFTLDTARGAGDRIRMYRDGVKVTNMTVNTDGTGGTTATDTLYVGSNNDVVAAISAVGFIHQLATWDRTLSDEEGTTLTKTGNDIPLKNMVHLYNFIEGNAGTTLQYTRNEAPSGQDNLVKNTSSDSILYGRSVR